MAETKEVPFTPQGYEELKAELERLKHVERPKVIEDIAEARAHGDLKENAEYHAAREKQGFIEARITVLEDQISRAKVIDLRDENPKQVMFGAFVTVEDEDTGDQKTYRIVGDLEADIEKNRISLGSPIAKALMGKRVDDLVEVKVPKGLKEYSIKNLVYDE